MKTKRVPEYFTWTVRVSVHKSWVADGFDLDDERAHDMLASTLPYAYNEELRAKVVKTPDAELIRKAQGY